MNPRRSRLPDFVVQQGSRIAGLRIAVVGVGSVGSNVARHAACLGIRELLLVDRGVFKAESLETHAIGDDDVGYPKATRLAARYGARAHQGPVETLPRGAFRGLDAVVLATDNLAAEVETGQRCLNLRVPLVQASVHGETLVAQVRTFTAAGPCPACGYGRAEWDELYRDTVFSCEGGPARTGGQPTRSVSFLCALAADLAMMQVLRPGLGLPLEDEIVTYCGYTHATTRTPLRRNPDCPCDHTPWTVRPRGRTLQDLFGSAGIEPRSVSVEGALFVESSTCDCRTHHPVRCFVPDKGAALETCESCRQPRRPHPFSKSDVPVAMLEGLSYEPLGALGVPSTATVLVRSDDDGVLFVPEEQP